MGWTGRAPAQPASMLVGQSGEGATPGACRPRKTCNCLPCQPSEQNIRSKCRDVLAVGFFLQRQARLASTHRVTSPFPGSLHPKIHHIHRLTDFRDVYAGIGLDSRPYDAISDVFLALPPVPAELHALRLHLACSGRLFQGNPFSFGQLRSLRGSRHECNAANKYRGDNAGG